MQYEYLLTQIYQSNDKCLIDELYKNFTVKQTEIIIHTAYGEINVSNETCQLYFELTNKKIDNYVTTCLRTDETLISCIKKIHKKIFDETTIPKRQYNGRGCGNVETNVRNVFENVYNYPEFDIEVYKIPLGIKYIIHEYDGFETLQIDFNTSFAIIVSMAIALNMEQTKLVKFITFLHDSMKKEAEKYNESTFLQ